MTSLYKVTESILYNYKEISSYIEELEERLKEAEKSSWADLKAIQYDKINIKTYGITKSTENVALAKIEYIDELNKELIKNKNIKLRLEKAFKSLKNKEKKLIDLIYFKEVNYKKCLEILKIEKRAYFYMKDRVVKKIAVSLFGISALEDEILSILGYKHES